MTVSGNDGRPELDGLRAFVREGDRNRARFFVGREAQLRDIEAACADAFAGFRAGRPLAGTTRLIQGAPGAGKTALLRRFEDIATRARTERSGVFNRLFAAADRNHPRTGVMLVDVDDLGHPERLVRRIAEWLDPKKARRLRQTRSRSAGVRAGTPGIGASSGGTVSTGPPQGDLAELGRLFAPRDWPGPLCLMVDEIQTMQAEQVPVLQSLHLATVGLPVVPVLAGLANARDVLARCGISRLSEDGVHMLGCLDAGEPAEAVRRMLADSGYGRTEPTPDAGRHVWRSIPMAGRNTCTTDCVRWRKRLSGQGAHWRTSTWKRFSTGPGAQAAGMPGEAKHAHAGVQIPACPHHGGGAGYRFSSERGDRRGQNTRTNG